MGKGQFVTPYWQFTEYSIILQPSYQIPLFDGIGNLTHIGRLSGDSASLSNWVNPDFHTQIFLDGMHNTTPCLLFK